jgi:transcriptional regulator with XRE-family HTH domain
MPPSEPADEALAAAIKRQREARDFTQEEAAHAAHVTIGTYSQVERGKVNPTWITFKGIARGLGITPAELAALAERVEEPAAT